MVLLLLFLVVVVLAGQQAATAKPTGEVVVFWGRNKAEGSLRKTCDRGCYTTVIISFFSVFGHGKYWTDLCGHHYRIRRVPANTANPVVLGYAKITDH